MALAASLVASAAGAQEVDNWMTSRGEDVFDFVDAATITQRADGSRTAWVTVVLTGEKQRSTGVKYSRLRYVYSCAGKTASVAAWTDYLADGMVKDRKDYGKPPPGSAVIPNSIADLDLKFVCGDRMRWLAEKTAVEIGEADPLQAAEAAARAGP
jgi:hypothetical protein